MTPAGTPGTPAAQGARAIPGTPVPPGSDRTPWLLRRVSRRYREALTDAAQQAGFGDLAPQGFWALDALASGVTAAGDLARVMGISRQAVSVLVETLVAGGYVVRRPRADDRRRVDLALTGRGRRAAGTLATAAARVDGELRRVLGAEGLRDLRRALTRAGDPPPGSA